MAAFSNTTRQPTRFDPKSPVSWVLLLLVIGLFCYQAYQTTKPDQAPDADPKVAQTNQPATPEPNKTVPATDKQPPRLTTNEPVPTNEPKRATEQPPITTPKTIPQGTPKPRPQPPVAKSSNLPFQAPTRAANDKDTSFKIRKPGTYRITHIADGDTFNLDLRDSQGRNVRVRLVGINCPEIAHPEKGEEAQPWSSEAHNFTKKVIADNRNQIRVEFDPDYDQVDHYGRWLCWAYYTDSKTGEELLLNEELLRQGYAFCYTNRRTYHYSEAMFRRLKSAEDEAYQSRRGIHTKK